MFQSPNLTRVRASSEKPDIEITGEKQAISNEKCDKHGNVRAAVDPITGDTLCNMCLFDRRHLKNEDSLRETFTAIATKQIKRKFDQAFQSAINAKCEFDELQWMKLNAREKVKDFFQGLRKEFQCQKEMVQMQIDESEALRELKEQLEKYSWIMEQRKGEEYEKEWELVMGKIERGRFAYLARREQAYKAMIEAVANANQEMKVFAEEVSEKLGRVFREKEGAMGYLKEELKSLVASNIKVDDEEMELEDLTNLSMGDSSAAYSSLDT